jgi:hypothetical protein
MDQCKKMNQIKEIVAALAEHRDVALSTLAGVFLHSVFQKPKGLIAFAINAGAAMSVGWLGASALVSYGFISESKFAVTYGLLVAFGMELLPHAKKMALSYLEKKANA